MSDKGFTVLRSMKVQRVDGGYDIRQPGEQVTEAEAALWSNPALWVRRGHVRPNGGQIHPTDRGVRQPMRAVTEKDIAEWNARKAARENGEVEPKLFVPGEAGSGSDGDGVVQMDELLALSKEDLLALAEQNGVEIKKKASKEDIAQAILDATVAE